MHLRAHSNVINILRQVAKCNVVAFDFGPTL